MTSRDIDRTYEFLLSDHPAAKAERQRRRAAHYAHQAATTDAVAAWQRRIEALGDTAPAHLRDLTRTIGQVSDRASLRDRVDEAEPDDLAVARERRQLESHIRASGIDPDYRYPDRYLGPTAATQPNLLPAPQPDRPAPRPEEPGLDV